MSGGIDYVSLYYNRMENLNIATTIALIAGNIAQARAAAKVLGASYKKVKQINRTLEVGVSTVTVNLN
ncbi:hypothetical protein LGW34_02645 [Streptococcus mutans]|uniref:hypothetical protein n=1 Tax=Streptococcus mutans TaxID=1309 RepID=UPI001CFD3E96|nr:hypothetical protein [Streptococcus mutans]MCB4975310.1 hypothetical protein [Streptococcus mutans]MCB4998547.1 hypothetical protein [Streptococcus mutans]MCB5021098.1 hypothetical protein [Streptococcus mutans]MCB5090291.1 hypothetical protein [Streptococcus mutans]